VTKYEGNIPTCWNKNEVSDSERSVSPLVVLERNRANDAIESLTSLAAGDNDLAANSSRRSRRFRRTPTYLRDFDIMVKQHKRGKGAEERRRQRRAALQPPSEWTPLYRAGHH